MPEYLAPGVYVEEVSFRSKSIEGVATSTTGFAGMAQYGPVQYTNGPKTTEPRLVGSLVEYESIYGGLESINVGPAGSTTERLCYMAHAVRAFFDNGGQRLYISRVFVPRGPSGGPFDWGVAFRDITFSTGGGSATATWRARWPGAFGKVLIQTKVNRSKNIAVQQGGLTQAMSAKNGAVVEIYDPPPIPPATPAKDDDPLDLTKLAVVQQSGTNPQTFINSAGTIAPSANAIIQLVELSVLVTATPERVDAYSQLGGDPSQKRYIGKILDKDNPEDENAVVWLDWTPGADLFLPARLMAALQGTYRLDQGHDGLLATPDDLLGSVADPDNADKKATGLEALAEIDDIAIIALPDGGTYDNVDQCTAAADRLISNAEKLKYRIAVVDPPDHRSLNEIRAFRGGFDSKYAALYYPWIVVEDPTQRPSQGAPPPLLTLPPSGFVAGIYARSDVERGVHKAPANEIVHGLTKFEMNINKARQDVINPEGINALRFFEGRGNRVWGARTMSSDPEWKYVNVRRLFIFLEHSIDRGTQWAVFEPNGPQLWANVRQTVEDFLLVQWRDGALLGDKPEQAYFVRCDRTTMTQNDLDNGRLIVLIGVAPVKPAEFVIFRIGQWTANSTQ